MSTPLPTEVLQEVFSYLPTSINISQQGQRAKFEHLNKQQRLLRQPILVLRQVCRQFRAIVNNLPFWRESTFDFVSLIAVFHGEYCIRGADFVQSLLGDKDFVDILERRRGWTFSNYSVFRIVSEAIPNFNENVIELAFVRRPNGKEFMEFNAPCHDWLYKILVLYPNLRSLTTNSLRGIRLSKLFENRPELSVLRIFINDYEGIRCSTTDFNNLRELVLEGLAKPRVSLPRLSLPIKSAKTLQVLSLVGRVNPFTLESLPLCTNLASLTLAPCDGRDFDAIITASSTLTELNVACWDIHNALLEKIIELVSSPAAKRLSKFSVYCGNHASGQRFISWMDATYPDRFLFALASNCRFLQEINLTLPLHSHSFRHLSRLSGIKSVTWKGELFDGGGAGDVEGSRIIAQNAIEDAFGLFKKKPKCKATVVTPHR